VLHDRIISLEGGIVPNEQLTDRARDELFSHINRCGVLKSSAEDQKQWMDETIEYIGERYPDLTDAELTELLGIGIHFCKPTIPHGVDDTLKPEGDANAA
jgi:hypothetical protein